LLAIAKYDERYVIPPAHYEDAHKLENIATECSLNVEGGPGMGGMGGMDGSFMENPARGGGASVPSRPEGKRINLLIVDRTGTPKGLPPDSNGASIAGPGA
ncbi:MAG: hypothetical protein L0H23_12120, partial [Luteimonas sp.]|nr:hypothetical protein [Luteimonas sp.]